MSRPIPLPEGSVYWPVASLHRAAQGVRHSRTQIHRARGGMAGLSGSTRWERGYADAVAWVEWSWVEMAHRTVVQADPLNVRSNVLLLDERGCPLLSSRRRAALATLVYLLPWQGPVLDALSLSTTPSRRALGSEQRLAA
jgi:hypothetical protein